MKKVRSAKKTESTQAPKQKRTFKRTPPVTKSNQTAPLSSGGHYQEAVGLKAGRRSDEQQVERIRNSGISNKASNYQSVTNTDGKGLFEKVYYARSLQLCLRDEIAI